MSVGYRCRVNKVASKKRESDEDGVVNVVAHQAELGEDATMVGVEEHPAISRQTNALGPLELPHQTRKGVGSGRSALESSDPPHAQHSLVRRARMTLFVFTGPRSPADELVATFHGGF